MSLFAPPFLPPLLAEELSVCELQKVTIGRSQAGTWRCIYKEAPVFYLKVMERGELRVERDRLLWLSSRLPVPAVELFLEMGEMEYLLTRALEGVDCASLDSIRDAERSLDVLREALALLHSVPIEDCPFDQGISVRLAQAAERVERGEIEVEFDDAPKALLDHLVATAPSFERKIASHGDLSLPNIIINDGRLSGFIDVGRFGVADLYQDVAILLKSATAPYNPLFNDLPVEEMIKNLIGGELDRSRIRWFQDLEELF